MVPRLFDDKGEFIPADESTMDPPTRERYGAIRRAFTLKGEAVAALDAAKAEVTAALDAIKQAEAFHLAHWPKQTQYDLWRENFSGGPRNLMRALGLTRN